MTQPEIKTGVSPELIARAIELRAAIDNPTGALTAQAAIAELGAMSHQIAAMILVDRIVPTLELGLRNDDHRGAKVTLSLLFEALIQQGKHSQPFAADLVRFAVADRDIDNFDEVRDEAIKVAEALDPTKTLELLLNFEEAEDEWAGNRVWALKLLQPELLRQGADWVLKILERHDDPKQDRYEEKMESVVELIGLLGNEGKPATERLLKVALNGSRHSALLRATLTSLSLIDPLEPRVAQLITNLYESSWDPFLRSRLIELAFELYLKGAIIDVSAILIRSLQSRERWECTAAGRACVGFARAERDRAPEIRRLVEERLANEVFKDSPLYESLGRALTEINSI